VDPLTQEIEKNMKICILGASGMLGSALYNLFSETERYVVFGTCRDNVSSKFQNFSNSQIVDEFDLNDWKSFVDKLNKINPDVVVNCVGAFNRKTSTISNNELFYLNSVVPRRLNYLSKTFNFRLIHISSDRVFDGLKGNYSELEIPNATDQYGLSKFLGESEGDNSVILRLSIIGHDLLAKKNIIDWFLSQKDSVEGFENAIFSGLPTNVVGDIILRHIIPNQDIRGVYHLSSNPISKFDLLSLVKNAYGSNTEIKRSGRICHNFSLDSSRFTSETGYISEEWAELIEMMRAFGEKYYV
jgi:dTDP-4-dehydrorhamnose reductase